MLENLNLQAKIDEQIRAAAPIKSIRYPDLEDPTTWEIIFDPSATAQQQADAQAIIDDLTLADEEQAFNEEIFNFITSPATLKRFVVVMMNEINILRRQHGLPDRTLAQLKQAIKNEPEP